MLAAPNTGMPLASAQRISLWRTAGTFPNEPSMRTIARGEYVRTARTTEPCSAGGR